MSEGFGLESISSWMGTDEFSRTVNTWFTMIVPLFVGKICIQYPILVIADSVFYLYINKVEKKLTVVMYQMATYSSSYFETPHFLIPWGVGALVGSVTCTTLALLPIVNTLDFISTYLYTALISLAIFLLSTGLKCIFLGSKIVTFKYTRRGFFGVFQRIFIFIREILVTFRWICYFSNYWPIPSLVTIITGPKTPLCLFYIVSKAIFLLISLFDLYFSIKNYTINSAVAFKPVRPEDVHEPCVICQGPPDEPIMLSCGHIFCYGCAYRWLSQNSTCPLCRAAIAEKKHIEYSDGSMPYATYLCTF